MRGIVKNDWQLQKVINILRYKGNIVIEGKGHGCSRYVSQVGLKILKVIYFLK
jgi:hypothetical protein